MPSLLVHGELMAKTKHSGYGVAVLLISLLFTTMFIMSDIKVVTCVWYLDDV